MLIPKFKNRENPRHVIDNSPVWLSRASAVVAEIILFDAANKESYVLLGKRGENTPDYQGYWSLPCGYLDWDETLPEAALREVYEECGLYIPNLPLHKEYLGIIDSGELLFEDSYNEAQPWYVKSLPLSKQNVSNHFKTVVSWNGNKFPELSTEFCEPGEVAELRWFKLSDALKETLAFNHNEVLKRLIEKTFIPFVK